jgi:hypothetical protein
MIPSKRCFTSVHCELQSKCSHSHEPYTNGYFQPTNVGEHCHQFKPLQLEYDMHEKIAAMMGAHS